MGAEENSRAQRDSLKETKTRPGAGRAGAYDALARYLESTRYTSGHPDEGRQADRRDHES